MPTDRDDPACIVQSDEAISLRKKHDLRAVIIIAVRKDGVIDVATDGQDIWHKDIIADYAHNLLTSQFSVAPMQTAFGVGNEGVPLRLSDQELAGLPQNVRAWVAANTHPKAVP